MRDRQCSLLISLNFYQTVLKSSPQTRFMFDIKKLVLIDVWTFIPKETQDNLLRIAINLPEFHRIPKAGHVTNYSKAESTVRPAMLRYSTTQFVNVSLCCVSLTWIKFIVAFFFLDGFSAMQQKKCLNPIMTGQNDWQDESLTGQVSDQARHCPWIGRYFQPWTK